MRRLRCEGESLGESEAFAKDVRRFRAFLEAERPVVNAAWEAGEFPRALIGRFGEVVPTVLEEDARPLFYGMLKLELGRVNPSITSFFSVHWGLARGAIARFGSRRTRTCSWCSRGTRPGRSGRSSWRAGRRG